VLPTKQQDLCQPLLDAVLANIRSPVFNHSLYRTFVPAMTAIHGPPIMYVQLGLGLMVGSGPKATCSHVVTMHPLPSRAPVMCTRKRKLEEDERQSIPNVLQGEVARLDPKFLVSLDPSHCSNNGTVHLICKLGECPGRAGGGLGEQASSTLQPQGSATHARSQVPSFSKHGYLQPAPALTQPTKLPTQPQHLLAATDVSLPAKGLE
jgi:hypothetical protein